MKTLLPTISPDFTLEDFNQSQQNRIKFIDFYLFFLGKVSRKELIDTFKISPAVATRDFSSYKDLFGHEGWILDTKSKSYVVEENFSPRFEHTFEDVITRLSGNKQFEIPLINQSLILCDLPPSLIKPKIDIFANISKALSLKKPLKITYHSVSSGESEKIIIPLALVNDGFRWHIRAFDRPKNRFADFVITRISSAKILFSDHVREHEAISNDIDWNRIVELELKPHPNRQQTETIEMDFGIQRNGSLKLNVRASNVGYVLQQWRVDCSSNHEIDDPVFRLWLVDNLVLYGIQSAEQLAPRFDKKRR